MDDEEDEHEVEDSHNSHMLGTSDDLPQLHDSDDEELIQLKNNLHGPNRGDHHEEVVAISEDEDAHILGRLRGMEDDVADLNQL